ncbi:aldo/keto reductase [Vineibacter terrae]|uniref:Aldo/keto reductase n=1 Tax=Vineibacter terrae TaxID=2586908 RepID=A0A5C8PLE4_9HYPH|nr:aldo/keto reductase [Vineibacter terrae]TXL74839.1 aldo/keto reductase [Vineibacter terrae]
MQKRKLGRSGIDVAPLALGGNVFGWTADEARSFAVLDGFVDAGFNLIDTADVYSVWAPGHKGGESETVIGNWLKRRGGRDKVVIATKVGMQMAPDRKGLAKDYILRSVEDSLKRLQTDYIDLYQSHRDDPDAPMEERFEAYAQLVKQGKVRAIGASNYDAARLKAALETSARLGAPRYETLQPHYNLCERALFEGPLQDLCVAEQIGVIGYYSLASGFLSGKYRADGDLGQSVRGAGVKKYLNPRGFGILKALDEVAAQVGATPAQVTLAWTMARPAVAAPIVSATSTQQLADILKAADVKLDAAAIARLDAASAPQAAAA